MNKLVMFGCGAAFALPQARKCSHGRRRYVFPFHRSGGDLWDLRPGAPLQFLHEHESHLKERDFWEKVSEEDMETIRQLREKGDLSPRDKLKMRWGCTLCRDWDSIGVDVEKHLKEK